MNNYYSERRKRVMEDINIELRLYCSDIPELDDLYEAIDDAVNRHFPDPVKREFECSHCDFNPGAHAWSYLSLARHKFEAHGIPGVAGHNNTRFVFAKVPWKERLKVLFTGILNFKTTIPK